MRNTVPFLVALALLLPTTVEARDDKGRYSIREAMNTLDAIKKLNKGYRFSFGEEPSLVVLENHGEFTSNKKTSGIRRTDKAACQRAFLSALLSFQSRIEREGGNAVINLKSYYKKREMVSKTDFECGSGALMSGVTLVGDVVTLGSK